MCRNTVVTSRKCLYDFLHYFKNIYNNYLSPKIVEKPRVQTSISRFISYFPHLKNNAQLMLC